MSQKFKQTKIFDVIEIHKEINLLQHRVKNSYDFVDKIILVIRKDTINSDVLKQMLSIWIDKIDFFVLDNNLSVFERNNRGKLSDFISSYDINFEDTICFSKINELPDFSNFERVIEYLKFDAVILGMTNFVFNTKTHSSFRHSGSICINYSMLIDNIKSLFNLEDLKNEGFGMKPNTVINGFCFDFFSDKSEILNYFERKNLLVSSDELESCICENIHPKFFETSIKYYLSDYEQDISFDVFFLREFFPLKNSIKKILILINLLQRKVDPLWASSYIKLFNINFTEEYFYPEYNSQDKIETFNIFLPKYRLYDKENYEFVYRFNEIKRILTSSKIMNEQIFDFVLLNDDFNNSQKISLSWSELKKIDPKEFFNGRF